jgi:hypothetical protein
MIPILLISFSIAGLQPVIEQIQFRTMESCESAAKLIEREYASLNAKAICIDRSVESKQ